MVFLAQVQPLKINLDEIAARYARPDYEPVRQSLRDVGIYSVNDLFSTYTGQKSDIGKWTHGSDINRDSNLRLSYLAGWGINAHMEDLLYRRMLRFRQDWTNIFTGSPEQMESLRKAIERASQ
jgi:hypothetical protein